MGDQLPVAVPEHSAALNVAMQHSHSRSRPQQQQRAGEARDEHEGDKGGSDATRNQPCHVRIPHATNASARPGVLAACVPAGRSVAETA